MVLINSGYIGEQVRRARKRLGVTQRELAMTSGTGLRFIIDLEKGKPTCHIGKALTVLHTVGIKIEFGLPQENPLRGSSRKRPRFGPDDEHN